MAAPPINSLAPASTQTPQSLGHDRHASWMPGEPPRRLFYFLERIAELASAALSRVRDT